MASSLSAYWVKFFKGAGFPQDVATKHAVVFSNNRIKPDMLPDLDKPSLKEMGITLMGDMIAILRYAKKVVEDTTCERFLVDTEDSADPAKAPMKPVNKKVVAKAPTKTVVPKIKMDSTVSKKIIKPTTTVVPKGAAVIKKPVSVTNVVSSPSVAQKKQSILKRKLEEEEEYPSSTEEDWDTSPVKKLKPVEDKEKVGYTVILPKGSTTRSQQLLKKCIDQKRTVFDRLGDSSVTSTTNLAETSPTFNVTGLGKDVVKRSASVFNRLGDKDAKKDAPQTGILKNGTSSSNSMGILKRSSPTLKTSIVTKKKIIPRTTGTMRADQETGKKAISNSVKQLVKTAKKISFSETSANNINSGKTRIVSGKLASERLASIPAKARLGVVKSSSAKQVTFNRIATVAQVRKPNVFSRLGM